MAVALNAQGRVMKTNHFISPVPSMLIEFTGHSQTSMDQAAARWTAAGALLKAAVPWLTVEQAERR